jgi:hypothetical protein
MLFLPDLKSPSVFCNLVLIIVGLVAALVVVSINKSDDTDDSRNSEFSSCSQKTTLKPQYTKSQDLYRDLSKDELIQVRNYILNVASLNVTPFEKATINSNHVFLIELQNPNKGDAIDLYKKVDVSRLVT